MRRGASEEGERVVVAVSLGLRELHADGRSLRSRPDRSPARGARCAVVAVGAVELIKAVEQRRPGSDRQHCSVDRARNLGSAKLPEQERARVRRACW